MGAHKPFDCVGTEEEATLAMRLAMCRRRRYSEHVPHVLQALEKHLSTRTQEEESEACLTEATRQLSGWDETVWLPSWLPERGLSWFLDEHGRDILHDASLRLG